MPNITREEDRGLISTSAPASAILWPEVDPGTPLIPGDSELFVFQYWPETVTDTEAPDYSEKKIPGGSHPLLQWTGGTGREITFTANFTAELDISTSSDTSLAQVQLLPSGRYTVDVRAAIARLKSYLRGDYPDGSLNQAVAPPKRAFLCLENMRLGGDRDEILVVLRQAPVVYEASFANGAPRVVQIACTFSECVQRKSADNDNSSQIQFLGRSPFEQSAKTYKYRGTVDKVIG